MFFRFSSALMLPRFVGEGIFALLMLATTSTALAHLMPAQQGSINLVDNAAFVVLSLPVSGMNNFDPNIDGNHDGRLSEEELRLQRAEIEQYVKQRLGLFDGDDAGVIDFIQISSEEDEQHEQNRQANSKAKIQPVARGAKHFLMLMKVNFKTAPKALRIEPDLFGALENEQQFTIKAIRGKEVEAIILTARHRQHHFFQPAWQVMIDYIATGVNHILSGFDHLLFLLTIIVAAAGWRYWIGILTCFTIAHSITLTLTLAGWVRAPASIIEPLIATSIVVMALLNLCQRYAAQKSRMIIVFACGLLHGMGFASSIADIGLHGTYFFISLLGFNLGIEIGQAIFLIAMLALGAAIQRIKHKAVLGYVNYSRLIKPITSSFAFVAGLFLLHMHLMR